VAQADGLKGQTDGSRQELRRAEMRVSRDEQLETATSGDEEAAGDWRRGGPAARTATGSARTGAATGGRPDDERTTAATGSAVRGRRGAGEDGDGTTGRRGDEICDGRPAEAAERRRDDGGAALDPRRADLRRPQWRPAGGRTSCSDREDEDGRQRWADRRGGRIRDEQVPRGRRPRDGRRQRRRADRWTTTATNRRRDERNGRRKGRRRRCCRNGRRWKGLLLLLLLLLRRKGEKNGFGA